MRIPFDEVRAELLRVLLSLGFREDAAGLCARLFTESSCDGVSSHGLNRFPRFCEMIHNGSIDVDAEPECVSQVGAIEQWDGHLGPGNLNAFACMNRTVELARANGIGCVALRNSNHWMRGGTYGWQAAEAGMIGMCWTNTLQNMPAWGSSEPRLGNNPLIIAVPRPRGHVVLDMSMSQFSYGALASYQLRGEQLPVDGGFDVDGRLTRDPAAIEESGRPLPIGYWKGSGLSLMLDLMSALLSVGRPVHEINRNPIKEIGLSQTFLIFDPSQLSGAGEAERLVESVIEDLHKSRPASEGEPVRYPGERTLATRKDNMKNGIPVEPSVWGEIQSI